jgi:hypothetical protein
MGKKKSIKSANRKEEEIDAYCTYYVPMKMMPCIAFFPNSTSIGFLNVYKSKEDMHTEYPDCEYCCIQLVNSKDELQFPIGGRRI